MKNIGHHQPQKDLTLTLKKMYEYYKVSVLLICFQFKKKTIILKLIMLFIRNMLVTFLEQLHCRLHNCQRRSSKTFHISQWYQEVKLIGNCQIHYHHLALVATQATNSIQANPPNNVK